MTAHMLQVKCAVSVQRDRVLYTLTLTVANPFEETAGAVLEVPRVGGLILLEEFHSCGAVQVLPWPSTIEHCV